VGATENIFSRLVAKNRSERHYIYEAICLRQLRPELSGRLLSQDAVIGSHQGRRQARRRATRHSAAACRRPVVCWLRTGNRKNSLGLVAKNRRKRHYIYEAFCWRRRQELSARLPSQLAVHGLRTIFSWMPSSPHTTANEPPSLRRQPCLWQWHRANWVSQT